MSKFITLHFFDFLSIYSDTNESLFSVGGLVPTPGVRRRRTDFPNQTTGMACSRYIITRIFKLDFCGFTHSFFYRHKKPVNCWNVFVIVKEAISSRILTANFYKSTGAIQSFAKFDFLSQEFVKMKNKISCFFNIFCPTIKKNISKSPNDHAFFLLQEKIGENYFFGTLMYDFREE